MKLRVESRKSKDRVIGSRGIDSMTQWFIVSILLTTCYLSLVTALNAQTLSGGASLSGGTMLLPPACGSGSITAHAGGFCTLNGKLLITYPGDPNAIYNPAGGDCVTTGSGPACPSQSDLQITQGCSVGSWYSGCGAGQGGINATRQIISLSHKFNFSCSAACSMTLKVHDYVQYSTSAAVRLNGAGGTGNFSITGTQTIAAARRRRPVRRVVAAQ